MRRLAVLLALAAAAAPASASQTIDRVMAAVGGRIVTLSDVRAAREFGLVAGDPGGAGSRAVLDRLIDRILMLEEVERYAPPEPHPAAVAERIEAIRSGFESPEAFAAAMRHTGLDDAALRQWVRNDLRIRAYLDQRFAAVVEPAGEELEDHVRQLRSELGAKAPDDTQLRRLARERAVMERRQALVRDWVEGLRRRSAVTYTETPP